MFCRSLLDSGYAKRGKTSQFDEERGGSSRKKRLGPEEATTAKTAATEKNCGSPLGGPDLGAQATSILLTGADGMAQGLGWPVKMGMAVRERGKTKKGRKSRPSGRRRKK